MKKQYLCQHIKFPTSTISNLTPTSKSNLIRKYFNLEKMRDWEIRRLGEIEDYQTYYQTFPKNSNTPTPQHPNTLNLTTIRGGLSHE